MISINGVDYADSKELAEMLHINKTRIAGLRRQLPHFPRPAGKLGNGDLYNYSECAKFSDQWNQARSFLHGDQNS